MTCVGKQTSKVSIRVFLSILWSSYNFQQATLSRKTNIITPCTPAKTAAYSDEHVVILFIDKPILKNDILCAVFHGYSREHVAARVTCLSLYKFEFRATILQIKRLYS